jgi:GT2 family glycosyltransferase
MIHSSQVAIVILNWNGVHFLEQFLPSVIQHAQNARIVVADNASSDNSVSFLQTHFPQIEIIQNDQNGGFAKGYNDALKHVDSPFYLLLNSDIEVTENWLNPLLESISNEQVAGCQPKVLAFHDKTRFEHAGASGGFLDRNFFPFCRGRILSETEVDQHQYENETSIFWSTGACMLIRSELFHQVGGFDEDFFAHMEEIDLCWRIKQLGYDFKVNPSATVYHVGGGTLSYLSPKKTYLNFRNSLFMITKNYSGPLFIKLFYRMLIDGVAGGMFLVSGKPTHFWAVFKAHIDFYKKIRTMLQKRKVIQASTSNFNATGIYRGSILWARYFKKIKQFSKLNMRLFS